MPIELEEKDKLTVPASAPLNELLLHLFNA